MNMLRASRSPWMLAAGLSLICTAGYAARAPEGHRSAVVAASRSDSATANPMHLSHGRFRDFLVYQPVGTPKSFALLLSGEGGWTPVVEGMARQLMQQGAMVTGIDLPKFRASLEADGDQCVFPDGDLENLSHFVQAYMHLRPISRPCSSATAQAAPWHTPYWPKRPETLSPPP